MIEITKYNEIYSFIRYIKDNPYDDMALEYLDVLGRYKDKKLEPKSKKWLVLNKDIEYITNEFNKRNIGSELKLPPYKYQKDAVRACLNKTSCTILAPCGAGKTYMALCLASELQKYNAIKPPYLIVVKAALKTQWFEEIKKFSNYEPVVIKTWSESLGSLAKKIKEAKKSLDDLLVDAIGNKHKIPDAELQYKAILKESEERFKSQFSSGDIFIINYETLNDEAVLDYFIKNPVDYIFADEIHFIKSDKAQKSKNICKLSDAKYKFGATATLVKKNPEDIYSIYKFLKPDLFKKKSSFCSLYLKYGGFGRVTGSKNEKQLHDKIKPYLVILTKEQVSSQLPSMMVNQIYCDLTVKQEKMTKKILDEIDEYRQKEKAMFAKNPNLDPKNSPELAQIEGNIMARQTFAQQLCNDERLLKISESHLAKTYMTNSESSKLSTLMDLLEQILDDGEKVAIFSKYLYMHTIISEQIKKLSSGKGKVEAFEGVKIAYVHGSMDADTRYDEVYNKFRDNDEYKILLCSDSANEGLNLSKCKYLIEYELADSYASQKQRHGRLERADSIHDTVFVYQLIAKNSYDEIQAKIISKKEKYDKEIVLR